VVLGLFNTQVLFILFYNNVCYGVT